MGMTWEQFWLQDCSLVIAYRKAYKIRQEEANRAAWLQGIYILKALQANPLVVYGFAKKETKPEPYPNKPIEFTAQKKTKQQIADDEAKKRADRLMKNMIEYMAAQRAESEMRKLADTDKEVTDGGRRDNDPN